MGEAKKHLHYVPRSIKEQMWILKQLFPGQVNQAPSGLQLKLALAFSNMSILESVALEGVFVVPRWERIASSYAKATEKVLDLLKKTRHLRNCRDGKILNYLKRNKDTEKLIGKIVEKNGMSDFDVVVIPAQTGILYQGKSFYQAKEKFLPDEFGLGIFEVACILLTHPERLCEENHLRILCADDYSVSPKGGKCNHIMYFGIQDGLLQCGRKSKDFASGLYGLASGIAY